jgi:hypothetical protein
MRTRRKVKHGRTSGEPWEFEYLHQQLPAYSGEDITRVLDECKKELEGSEDRSEIETCARKKLA